MSISRSFVSCLQSFNGLITHIDSPGYGYGDDVPIASWIDELGRIRIWAANVGAHQSGQSSLEFRLRDASHISDETMNLLGGLEGLLSETREYITEGPYPDENILHDETFNEEPTTEIRSLYDAIVNVIQCLYKLAILIRNPAQHDFLTQSRRSDTSAFKPYDMNHVRDKFPQADAELVLRLGKAITRRRGYFKYRERHNAKLGKGLEESLSNGEHGTGTESISETMASSFKPQLHGFDETASSGSSQTSNSSVFDSDTNTLPALPKEAVSGRPFVCPFCFCILNIDTTRSWHRHIYLDLRPYVCLFHGCRIPDRLYSSRRDWFSHVCEMHDVVVADHACPLCQVTLHTVKQYERHLSRHCEELALFALPFTGDEEPDENAKSSTITSDAGSSRSSAGSNYKVEEDKLDSLPNLAEDVGESLPSLASALDLSTSGNASPKILKADDQCIAEPENEPSAPVVPPPHQRSHRDPSQPLDAISKMSGEDQRVSDHRKSQERDDWKRRMERYDEEGERILSLYRREMEEGLAGSVKDITAQSNSGEVSGNP
ncbi:MAG: hypothetical protein Q9209_005413 [Squamulea sp. 1 TL-2023]